ncbi:MAG: TetR/AcrR family transcriptional regulator, partial [Acidimicrobiia bacterium]|nr:TetR/AcrR family transcriptional regulator [Acidimicrobiia bacterium]
LTSSQVARRQRVIRAALDLAASGGYDAVQMRDVASSASVALGTVYRYFSSKDHLLAATLVEWVRDLERRLAARPPRGDTVADRVVDVIGRASRAMDRDPLLSAALVTAVSSPDPAVSACQLEVTRAISATLLVAMDGVDEERRQGVVKVLSHVWFSSLVGWVSGWSNVGSVGDELETAARLLLRE